MEALQYTEVIARGDAILRGAGLDLDPSENFLDWSRAVADVLRDWPADDLDEAWCRPFAIGLKMLDDDFLAIVEADPMVLYRPQHNVALEFHSSPAFIRYNRSANRTSKSQSGYAEHYYVATDSHPWRTFVKGPTASFIIGVNFSKYAPKVFEAKFVHGETDNPLSPMFPEGGKWFNHYNDRKHILKICCADCAKEGRAQQCKHLKSSITLFSDLEGPDVLQGAQYNLGHFDEHIKESFFDEAFERMKTVAHSSLMVTGTPLLGKSSWEHQRMTSLFNKGPKYNRIPGTDTPMVSLHTIDQYEAGLVPHELIEASKLTMDPIEQEARIYGKPGALAKHSVFDRYALHAMEDDIVEPRYGYLDHDGQHVMAGEEPVYREHPDGFLRVWEEPDASKQYVIGSDIAAGLTDRDYSCSTVLSVPDFRVVAQLHGWINPRDHAMEATKLGRWYGWALLIPERTGMGIAMIQELEAIGYWNIYRDVNEPTAVENIGLKPVLGIDTNMRTKAYMVSALQRVIRERQIYIPCAWTVEELRAFGQELTGVGDNVRLRGESGSHDDRVMSLVLAVYVATNFCVVDFSKLQPKEHENPIWREVHRELAATNKSPRDRMFNGT